MNSNNPKHAAQLEALVNLAIERQALDKRPEQPHLARLGLKLPEINARWKIRDQYVRVIAIANEKSASEPVVVVFQATRSGDIFTCPIERFISRFELKSETTFMGRTALSVDAPSSSSDLSIAEAINAA